MTSSTLSWNTKLITRCTAHHIPPITWGRPHLFSLITTASHDSHPGPGPGTQPALSCQQADWPGTIFPSARQDTPRAVCCSHSGNWGSPLGGHTPTMGGQAVPLQHPTLVYLRLTSFSFDLPFPSPWGMPQPLRISFLTQEGNLIY